MSRQHLLVLLLVPGCVTDTSRVDQPIIGGASATPAEFPTVVVLETASNWECTGTLIDKDWVLSAAHCVEGATTATMRIRFDDANLNDTTGGKLVAVTEIHAKPGWVDPVWDNDVALLRLATSVTDREPTPVARTPIAAGAMTTNVGYGDSDNNGNGSGVLRKLVATTIDCATTGDPDLSGANLLCFDPTNGRASCDGDSGGPAFVTVNGKLRVAGINSGNTGNTCTTGWELYTSVHGELDFIDMYVAAEEPSDPTDPTDPTDPPDPTEDPPGDDPATSVSAGCSAVVPAADFAMVALVLLLVPRRRRRRV